MQTRVGQKSKLVTQQGAIFGSVAAVLVVVLAVILTRLPRHSTMPPTSNVPTATHQAAPTPTTSPSSPLTPAQAWGTTGTLTLHVDTKKYTIQGILPGGAGVVATTYTQTSQTDPTAIRMAIVYITTADGTIHTIANGAWTHASAATDGRYIAWLGGFNPMGGPGDAHQTLGYYDLQTGQSRTVLDVAQNYFDGFHPPVVTHGHLLLTKQDITPATATSAHSLTTGLFVMDLATGTQQTLLNDAQGFAASWPYALVAGTNSGNTRLSNFPMTLINVQTGQQRDVTNLVDYINGISRNFALDGTTIFATHADASQKTEGYYQIDHADQPGAQPTALFTLPLPLYPSIDDAFTGADARILSVAGDGLKFNLWDRALQRPISTAADSSFLFDNGVIAYTTTQDGSSVLYLQDESNFKK